MNFKEQTLEDIIWDNSQTEEGRKLLKNRGLVILGNIYRQVDLGSYGRADLITVFYNPSVNETTITVYELKKGSITKDAFMQACRYITGIKRHGFDEDYFDTTFIYRICLIGDYFDSKNDFCYLYNESFFADAYVYDYAIDGISFKLIERNWSRVDEKLNEESVEPIGVILDSEIANSKEDDTTKQEFSHELPF